MSNQSFKILVVDDDENIISLMTDVLDMADAADVTCSSCLSAEAAIEMLDAGERFDAIVSDFYMDEMSGSDLLKKVHEIDGYSPLFYLATGNTDSPEKGLENFGLTKLVQKPYDIFDFVDEVIEALLNK